MNLLLEEIDKESITKKFRDYGISYKKDEDSYKSIDVPTYTMEILKDYKRNIIITLKKIIDTKKKDTVSFMNLLQELGEKKDDKKIKVRYGHHIAYLKKKNWVFEKSPGRQNFYGLTPEGRILSIMHTYLKEEAEVL